MPHDAKGTKLELNDVVNLPCIVTALQAGDEFCNCTVETLQPMFPGTNKVVITVNTKQVIKNFD